MTAPLSDHDITTLKYIGSINPDNPKYELVRCFAWEGITLISYLLQTMNNI